MAGSTTDNQGKSFPLGAAVCPDGVNFSVFSKHSTAVDLLLFERVDDPKPSRVVALDPRTNRTYHYWHTFVSGVKTGQLYAYRVSGPYAPERGLRFDPDKVLLDPYGKCVARPAGYSRQALCHRGDNAAVATKSVVAGGFTRHRSSGIVAARRGTYAGLAEKAPYLQDLGVTAVELLPVFAFDEQDGPAGLGNYWGYAPLSFFAPHDGYSSRRDPLGALNEVRDMVKALHQAGMEVLLDVVYNHTTEGNETGPTLCFRGLANDTYYILGEDRSSYANYSGCGNTLNANESICRRLILDSLRYWVSEMHVDGFRFDLASILSRDSFGRPLENPPILWDIESDPVLANVKLIAEAWDAAGLYQVGRFVGDRRKEWNGRFRDDVRAFLKGDVGVVRPVAYRLIGSPDLYEHKEREPEESINFITCHDGLTLNDMVSYNRKHNEENGEDNRDGTDNNLSWNCGAEGPTEDPAVERLRNRQVKNFLTLTLLSVGTPMLLMGDEMRRTQRGNNNAYCQNNETSWLGWDLLARHADIYRFVKQLISLRLRVPIERSDITLNELLRRQPVQWQGVRLNAPDWSGDSHSLAATVRLPGDRVVLHLMVNAYWKALQFEIPPVSETGEPWRRCVDTFLDSPDDIYDWARGPIVSSATYLVQPRSVVLLVAQAPARTERSKRL